MSWKNYFLTLIGILSSRVGKSGVNIQTELIQRSSMIKLLERKLLSYSIVLKLWLLRSFRTSG